MSEPAWTRPKGSSRKPGARPPTEEEQAEAEMIGIRVWELIERLQTLGFSEHEAVVFIAETAMAPNLVNYEDDELVPNWSTKAGAIRVIRRFRDESAATLDWGQNGSIELAT